MSDFSLPNRNAARARATSVLPTPVGPRNRNEPAGRALSLQARARAADGARQRRDGLLLADDALVQLFFDAQQLGDLFFLDGRHRHAGPARHHVFDVVLGDDAGRGVVEIVLLAQLAHVLALFALFVGVEARLLELVVRDGVLHAVHDELDALLNVGQIARQRGLAQLHARAGFVDQIDGLVRQEAVRNVAVRSVDRGLDGFVGVADGVEFLVAVLDAEQNLDGVGFARRRNFHGLEAALERAVFFDRLAILARRGGADALDLAARKRRLQNIGGVERAFGRSRAHQRVQLIDEDDGVLILHQLLHDGLEALFKLAAVLGAGHDERKIERQNALVGQERRHVALGDALRQAFDDGGLAHARLADQHRIVLGAAAQNLHHALQLVVAADQRIERVVDGGLRQIAAELGQQRAFLGPVGGDFFRLTSAPVLREWSKAAGRARAEFRRRSTSLRAAGPAADARCRCACG